MSRRSRRRHGVSGGIGWLGKSLIGLVVLGVIACAVLYAVVRGYLYSDGFRKFLADKVSVTTGVSGNFAPFRWDGLAVDSPSFEGYGSGMVQKVRLDGLHTEVGVSGISRGAWLVKGTRFQRLEVKLDARERLSPVAETEHVPSWLPRRVELLGLDSDDIHVDVLSDLGVFSAKGLRARVTPAGGRQAYKVDLIDGTVRLPVDWVPEIRVDRAKFRYQDERVSLNSLSANAWKTGNLSASGEWSRDTGVYSAEGVVDGVKCHEVCNEDWAKRVVGDLHTNFIIDNRTGPLTARGTLQLTNGTLTALPVLDLLAAYADTRRFRVLSLNDARSDWHWSEGTLTLSNLVLSATGLIELKGTLVIRNGHLDGNFRLGLAPGTLASIPGAETQVFSPGDQGLLWTPLRITGTLDDPKENLTERLIAAAGARMFDIIPETGEKVIRFTRTVVQDVPGKALDAGSKVIETGAGIVEGVGGVLDGILGGGRKPDEKKENP